MNDQLSQQSVDSCSVLRRSVYMLLIAASVAWTVGRIMAVRSDEGSLPFLSANDRSRWCTIRALVDQGTYAIDDVIQDRRWYTIDLVRHVGRDRQPHFYSSKPPLFSTLVAGQYWLIQRITGATLERYPFYVGRTILLITNVVPLLVYFALLVRVVERWGKSDWGRIFVMVVATWGTFLTTFAVTLNNHLPAAVCVLVAIYAGIRIWYDGERRWHYFAIAGLFAALAAANELPALSLLTALGVALVAKSVRHTLTGFVPAVVLVAAAFFGANYAAHSTLQAPYTQRHIEGGWYDFEGSYWFGDKRKGVDLGEPSRARYATHVLVGHHGIFSLTPVWLMSAAGAGLLLAGRGTRMPAFATVVMLLTVICFVFYILLRPADDRNYGGCTCGFRWLFWFIPLWLLAMIPAADAMAGRRWLRGLATVFLAISVMSASYCPLNPWSHPWIYQYWVFLGWIKP